MRTLVWFRGKDLRVADHAPLRDAALGELIPLFVLDPYFFAPERVATMPHRIQFLLESLAELEESLARLGSTLLVVPGRATEVVPGLARAWKVDQVVGHRWVEPVGRERDRRVAEALGDIRFVLHEGETLQPPGTLRTGAGGPYTVFTPFARAFARNAVIDEPLPAPRRLPPLPDGVRARTVPVPRIDALGVRHNPRVLPGGERAGRARLKAFLDGPGADYIAGRERLDITGTSRLSVDLKFGTLSARTIWKAGRSVLPAAAWKTFANELVWREFSHSTLWDRPELLERPFRPAWCGFPWRADERAWQAWASGQTGYPVVDATARQLLAEGFIPNRGRMISASFLAKDLLVDFRRGERHYLTWLTDGDWAQNDLGWQWSAGCGCDAQPYFRVFNPVTQGREHDPDGDYVRRWVPELAGVPTKHVHEPWTMPGGVPGYPPPIVDHGEARVRFLAAAQAHLRASPPK